MAKEQIGTESTRRYYRHVHQSSVKEMEAMLDAAKRALQTGEQDEACEHLSMLSGYAKGHVASIRKEQDRYRAVIAQLDGQSA